MPFLSHFFGEKKVDLLNQPQQFCYYLRSKQIILSIFKWIKLCH